MLKKFALLFFCGFLSLNSKAQNFGGGFKIGLSTSQVGGDNLAGFNKAGLLIGVFANKNISNLLSFQMEMAYINKGSNNANMNNYSHSNYLKEDISLLYIEIRLNGIASAAIIGDFPEDQPQENGLFAISISSKRFLM